MMDEARETIMGRAAVMTAMLDLGGTPALISRESYIIDRSKLMMN